MFDWDAVKEAAERQERAERLRLYYVAMTRAIDRLIVSGAIDPERRPTARRRSAGCSIGSTPRQTVVEADDAPLELERGDARFVLTVARHA